MISTESDQAKGNWALTSGFRAKLRAYLSFLPGYISLSLSHKLKNMEVGPMLCTTGYSHCLSHSRIC